LVGVEHHFGVLNLARLPRSGLGLQGDASFRRKDEVEFLEARPAKPIVLDPLVFALPGDQPDNPAVPQVMQLSPAIRIETTVDHAPVLPCPET